MNNNEYSIYLYFFKFAIKYCLLVFNIRKWRQEMDNAKLMNRKLSLLRTLIQMIWVKYMFNGLLLFIVEVILK